MTDGLKRPNKSCECGACDEIQRQWRYNFAITTKPLAYRKRRVRMKSGAPFENSLANIIPTLRRTRRRPKKNLSRSTRPTKSYAIRRSAGNMTNWASIGISQAGCSRLRGGVGDDPEAVAGA